MSFLARRLAALTGAWVALCAGAAAASPFDGVWRATPTAQCDGTAGDGAILRIEDDTLYGAGAECRMTRPVNVRDMDAMLYDMVCAGDETTFTERALMLNAADGGIVLVWNGYAFKYEACSDVAGTVTTSDDIGIAE